MVRGGAWGVQTEGAISAQDIERTKAALARPGALTAALNYYRASMKDQTCHPCPELDKAITAVLQMPVLLMYAENDAAFCTKMFAKTECNAARLTTVSLPNCSHWANQDRPDLVNAHLKDFLDSTGKGKQQANRPPSRFSSPTITIQATS